MSLLKVLYAGTPQFAAQPLEALINDARYQVSAVITQPDAPAGRGKKLRASPVKKLAEANDIPVLQPKNIRKEGESFLEQLEKYGEYDIGVVCAFGQILPESFLSYPKHGCINIHASLLPRWRGAAPIHRAIIEGDTLTGITLMQMDKGLSLIHI